MKRGARGTQGFNSLKQSARLVGQIVFLTAIVSLSVPVVLAQQASDSLPGVRNPALHDRAVRINELLADMNDRHSERATHIINTAQSLLDRVVDATERRARRGYDVSAVREAIANARKKIDEARSIIRNQSDHDYVLDTATDATIRERLRAVRDQLADDLRLVRTAVRDALAAVRDVVRALRATRPAGS